MTFPHPIASASEAQQARPTLTPKERRGEGTWAGQPASGKRVAVRVGHFSTGRQSGFANRPTEQGISAQGVSGLASPRKADSMHRARGGHSLHNPAPGEVMADLLCVLLGAVVVAASLLIL